MLTVFAGLRCWLDIGAHTPETLTAWLRHLDATTCSPEEKAACIAYKMLGTPFQFESQKAHIPSDAINVCLSNFDCVTLIYHVLALTLANSFEEYVRRLFEIRYECGVTPRVSNEQRDGTRFEFACESLLENAVERGFLRDITASIAPGALLTVRVMLQPMARPREHDAEECLVYPRRGERTIASDFIPTQHIARIAKGAVKTGDIVVFTLGAFNADGSRRNLLIRHLGIAIEGPEQINMLHATKDFFWRPDNTDIRDCKASGVFIQNDSQRELIGVGVAGEYAGDEHIAEIDGVKFFGYHQTRQRALSSYAQNFVGVKFLRICRPESEPG